jgi:hypothetical protein
LDGYDEYDIWADSASNIYVSGLINSTDMALYHYNGASWSSIPDETTDGNTIRAIWGVSSTDIFGVGSQGKIIRYQAP